MTTAQDGLATLEMVDTSRMTMRTRRGEELDWGRRCRTTRWSVVLAAAGAGPTARAALSQLYRAYWYPVFAVVAKARGLELAAELTQEFIVTRLVERGDLSRINQRPGERFRGWLFTALHSFLKNQWQFERRQRRDVRRTVHLVGDAEGEDVGPKFSALADSQPDPEQRLGREQALALLAEVLRRLRREYCAKASTAGVNGELRFEALKVFLPGRDTENADYREAARSLGLGSDAVKQLVCRLRARFGQLLHDELAKGTTCASEVAAAKRALCQALSSAAPAPLATPNRIGV